MQKDRKRKKQMSENKVGYLFAAPGILGFLIFTAGPMLISLYYSFTEFSVLAKPKWNGLQNYITMLTSPSSLFLKSLSVTLIYAGLNAVLTMVFSSSSIWLSRLERRDAFALTFC